jgi:hypothetical protein
MTLSRQLVPKQDRPPAAQAGTASAPTAAMLMSNRFIIF